MQNSPSGPYGSGNTERRQNAGRGPCDSLILQNRTAKGPEFTDCLPAAIPTCLGYSPYMVPFKAVPAARMAQAAELTNLVIDVLTNERADKWEYGGRFAKVKSPTCGTLGFYVVLPGQGTVSDGPLCWIPSNRLGRWSPGKGETSVWGQAPAIPDSFGNCGLPKVVEQNTTRADNKRRRQGAYPEPGFLGRQEFVVVPTYGP